MRTGRKRRLRDIAAPAAILPAAIALSAGLTIVSGPIESNALAQYALVIGIAAIAARFRISAASNRPIYFDGIPIASAVLLFEPGPAALAVGVGWLAAGIEWRGNIRPTASRAGWAMLQTLAGGVLLGGFDWNLESLLGNSATAAAALAILSLVAYAMQIIRAAYPMGLRPVSLAPNLSTARSPVELANQAAQTGTGFAAAIMIAAGFWSGLLTLAPAAALLFGIQRHVQSQQQAIAGMLDTLSELVDYQDPYTAMHARRASDIARAIAREMGLPADEVDRIAMAARLHNLGNLTISDLARETSSDADADTWSIMRQVPAVSAGILARFPITASASELVRHHLERFDGEGYPDGLAGEDIPLGSRIIAVADSIDSMMRHRPYRPALARDELRRELERFRGTQWDPVIVDITLDMLDHGAISILHRPDAPSIDDTPRGRASGRTIEQQIQHLAFHDPLTDLPNRLLLTTRLSRSLAGADAGFAVLFIDMDGFKQINDVLGHRAGDRVLVHACERMKNELRSNDLLARLGGDEFVAVLWDVTAADEARDIARRIIRSLGTRFSKTPPGLRVSASIGIALAVPGEDTTDSLLHRADSAMYEAKRNGKGRVVVSNSGDPLRLLAG